MSLMCALAGAVTNTSAQQPQQRLQQPGTVTREFRASRTARPPAIDGQLTDEAWAQAQVLSDDSALYVGARLFDREVARIGRRLSTRDGDGDAARITLYLDPMHDHLTGVMFRVSAANVRTDAVLFNDRWDDWSWMRGR